jgi:hypothetical protein
MDMSEVHNIAKRLVAAHGNKAEVEATRKLQEAETSNDNEQIELWRRIKSAVRELRSAHES